MFKITNPLEQRVRCGKYIFEAKETKIMDIIPGVGFIIEEIEENEKPNKHKGGNK